MITQALTQKYRPTKIEDLVLPANHGLRPIYSFLAKPYPSVWLFTGNSGVGKSSLAEIIATRCANELHIRRFVGGELDSNRAREIEATVMHRPLFGQFHCLVVDEADQITAGAQIRLLGLLERMNHAIWVLTSNLQPDTFEPRFLSRVRLVNFSSQGLLRPGAQWLARIASLEGIPMDLSAAEKIVRDSKNNLRSALQTLELEVLNKAPVLI